MFRNHILIALRNLWINKTFSILNLLCLTFGLACFTIVVLHLLPTYKYNKFHSNYNDLCVLNAYDTTINDFQSPKALLPATLTNAIKEQMPEIKGIVRMANSGLSISYGNKSFAESGFYADNSLFNEFTFPVVQGDTSNWNAETNSILLSEQLAKKIFESTDCIGKMLTIQRDNARELVKVKGIFKDVPRHSSLHFAFVLPFSKYFQENSQAYKNGTISNIFWVSLKPNIQKNDVERKINSVFRQQEPSMSFKLYLYPLKEMSLYEYRNGQRIWIGNYLVLTSSIGLAILLIACFNFINLAIALNIKRNREVGIKKVVGAKKRDIVLQFLVETLIITLISMLIAIMILELIRTGFNARFGDDIPLSLSNGTVIISLLAIILFTTMVSGLLPAFYFASTNPLAVLKGKFNTSSFGSFRKGLVIFQFVIPILLIILTLFVKAQDSFLKRLDIGIDKDRLIVADYPADINVHAESLKSELQSFPEIEAVSYTNCIPASRSTPFTNDVKWYSKNDLEKANFWLINTDFDYDKAVSLKITAGRYFNPEFHSDSLNFVINDVAANVMKYTNPIGQSLTVEEKTGTIIGVFKDFYTVGMGSFVPTIIRIKSEGRSSLLVKFSSGSNIALSGKIKAVYSHYKPDKNYQVKSFREIYESTELKSASNLVGLASFIAILLACLGLFGLSSYTVVSRTKEIGIRKVNGAPILTVMRMLLGSYTRWITYAFLIAAPFAFLAGNMWLRRFHKHTPLPWWAFVVGAFIVYLVALLVVGWQTYSAAKRNPVDALRNE